MRKRFVLTAFCVLNAMLMAGVAPVAAADNSVVNTQGPGAAAGSPSSVDSGQKYSLEEYRALPDTQKREVYLQDPQKLPDNFNPDEFKEILHPE